MKHLVNELVTEIFSGGGQTQFLELLLKFRDALALAIIVTNLDQFLYDYPARYFHGRDGTLVKERIAINANKQTDTASIPADVGGADSLRTLECSPSLWAPTRIWSIVKQGEGRLGEVTLTHVSRVSWRTNSSMLTMRIGI